MPVTKSLLVWGLVGGLIIVGFLLVSDPAFATGSAGMPWENPMDKIKNSLTGPIAMAISLLGAVVAGVALLVKWLETPSGRSSPRGFRRGFARMELENNPH